IRPESAIFDSSSLSQCEDAPPAQHSFPTRRSSDLRTRADLPLLTKVSVTTTDPSIGTLDVQWIGPDPASLDTMAFPGPYRYELRSEEHTSELQSRENLVCRLLLEKKKDTMTIQSRY